MKHRSLIGMGVLIAFCLGSNAGSAELVKSFSGSGSSTTAEFEVQAPWILDWRVNSEYRKTMAVEIHLVDSLTGFHRGRILRTKMAGNGVRLFQQSGRFRFRVSATLSEWSLKVEELSPEEVELYTPRQ